MATRFRFEAARGAYLEQWLATEGWLGGIAAEEADRPSVLPGWRVADLVAHFVLVADSVSAALPAAHGTRAMSLAEYVGGYRDGADAIDQRTRAVAEDWADLPDAVSAAGAAASLALTEWSDDVRVARRGPIRASDFLVTRCIELVVHGDDLARSLGRDDVPHRRPALQLAVRGLASVLAARAPGQSVEVRVPPFAAVQCLAGPRHTRGTPPAVVETEPLTFLRLAAGRTQWESEVRAGRVRHSGERTDLSGLLPVLG